ncbi:MAG: helix-turn-helix domain-containing protein [Candidatus Acidiferrales bacterium]
MASFGENLRRERELRGITLSELANCTKIGVRHLEALERNQFHRLPGGIFNRGFVRAVARYMKLDEDFWISEYARATGEEPEVMARYVVETPSRPAAGRHRSAWSFVALLVLFAVGAYVVHDLRMRRAAEAAQAADAGPHPSALVGEQQGTRQPERLGAAPASVDSSSTATQPEPQPTSPEPAPVPAAPAASEAAPAADTAPADLRLQVDVVEEAWVRIAVDDQVRYQGQVKPGAPRRFRGSRRFEVSTRNASAVVLTLNGETLPPLGQPGEERTVVLTAQDLKPTPR